MWQAVSPLTLSQGPHRGLHAGSSQAWRLPLGREWALQGSQRPALPASHSALCIQDAEWARGSPSPYSLFLGFWTRPLYPHPIRTHSHILSSCYAPQQGEGGERSRCCSESWKLAVPGALWAPV